MGKTAQQIINELERVKPKVKARTNYRRAGASIEDIKKLKIRDLRKLTREYKL